MSIVLYIGQLLAMGSEITKLVIFMNGIIIIIIYNIIMPQFSLNTLNIVTFYTFLHIWPKSHLRR